MLLLLDNTRDEKQIAPLLPGHDGCRVLTTSRNRFTLSGQQPIVLGLIAEEEAIDLALKRANQRWERLNRAQAKMLVARCGRHPLAIEVAASTLGTARVLDVDAQIEKLGNPEKAALNMDQVKAVLRLSLDLLEPAERAAWSRLGVFEGDFDAEAAKAVMDVEDGDTMLATLETRHLVTCRDDNRLQLHDILRAIALEALDPAENEAARASATAGTTRMFWLQLTIFTLEGRVLDGLQLYDREQHQIQAGQAFAAARINNTDALARLAADYADAGVLCARPSTHAQHPHHLA